jgi:tetratricopeptide (TPR) repeat protein
VEDKRPTEAVAHFRESVRLKPDYAEAHYALGTVLYWQHELAPAAHEFDIALAGDLPSAYTADAHNNLGVILAQQARCPEAAPHFAEAARLKPELTAAHVNYARCLVARSRSTEAQAYLTQALRTNGENPDLRRYLTFLEAK